jgi:hypothetical protein
MNGESQHEVFLSILVLALATGVATSYIRLPSEVVSSPMIVIFLVIIALVSFSVFPMVGLSLFFLLAVLIFSRNVNMTVTKAYTNTVFNPSTAVFKNENATVNFPVVQRQDVLQNGNTTYGQRSIVNQRIAVPNSFSSFHSDPRSISQFNETDSRNPVLGRVLEGFEASNYADDVGSSVEGQYPTKAARASSNPDLVDYNYRPASDTGSNEFKPTNSGLVDEKMSSFKY